jgi:moderate conductance mechanosensitive channel
MSVLTPVVNFFISLTTHVGWLSILAITQDNMKLILYKLIIIFFIIIGMYLSIKTGTKIINKFVEKQMQTTMKFSLDDKKAQTLGAVLKSILTYCVYFFGLVAILTQCFTTISLTFAGMGGVAIAFGAQSAVKDIINGFFILFEDHYAVGDYVEIEGQNGIVESIELRITKIRNFNGDLYIIPNGLIRKVTNHSRGDMEIMVSIDLNYDQDMDKTLEVIDLVCKDFKNQNENVIICPSVTGITDLKENFYTIKVMGKAKSMTQWDCENKLRMDIKRALDKAQIPLLKL